MDYEESKNKMKWPMILSLAMALGFVIFTFFDTAYEYLDLPGRTFVSGMSFLLVFLSIYFMYRYQVIEISEVRLRESLRQKVRRKEQELKCNGCRSSKYSGVDRRLEQGGSVPDFYKRSQLANVPILATSLGLPLAFVGSVFSNVQAGLGKNWSYAAEYALIIVVVYAIGSISIYVKINSSFAFDRVVDHFSQQRSDDSH